MDQSEQLQSYIQNSRSNGLSEDTIRNELLRSGWPQATVDIALRQVPATQPANPHRVRNGVLWILSPFIVLTGAVVIELLCRLAGVNSSIINVMSVLVGIAGIILLPLGPILGIIKLTRP
jgi:hypothetical protein